mgnify:CR=1 FL=1
MAQLYGSLKEDFTHCRISEGNEEIRTEFASESYQRRVQGDTELDFSAIRGNLKWFHSASPDTRGEEPERKALMLKW